MEFVRRGPPRPRLRALAISGYLRRSAKKGRGTMSLSAVAVFLLFIVAIGALNYREFGRVD